MLCFRVALRLTNLFTIQPLDANCEAATRGAPASSWVRGENGKAVHLALRPRRLDGGAGITEFENSVTTTAQVALAALIDGSVTATPKLGVVPYGEGLLTLRRSSKTSGAAKVTEHYFGGQSQTSYVAVRQGVVEILLRERGKAGSRIEWIEVDFASAALVSSSKKLHGTRREAGFRSSFRSN